MNRAGWAAGIAAVLIVAASAQATSDPVLSPVEASIVSKKIAALRSPADRKVAGEWSNAKKVAELLCRPAALPVLKKQSPGVDRVFLGTDDPKTLTLESDRRLTGSGSARTPQGWQDFTFACDLDPDTGKVTGFTPTMAKAAQ